MSANCATWTSERIELLKRCLHAGSCGQTAREIGVTRNAVIGKMNRLGLSRPKDVIGKQLEQSAVARLARPKTPRTWRSKSPRLNIFAQHEMLMVTFRRPQPLSAEDITIYNGRGCTLLELSQGEMPLADQQPGRPGLLLLRERTSQRIALLPGARAHRISVGRSAAQPGGCVSIPPPAAPPSSVMNSRRFIRLPPARASSAGRYFEAERRSGLEVDHKLVPGRRLYRQVAGLLALENAIDIAGRAPVRGYF